MHPNLPHSPSPRRSEPLSPPSKTQGKTASHWRVQDIDFSAIDRAAVQGHEDLFFLLTSASFIETGSDTYAANLAEHFAAWPDIASWLSAQWEGEELQHGSALRAYVEAVWPAFPWQKAYDSFFAEYSQLCTTEELDPDPRLELVARCVVETSTTVYYHTLRDLTDEPVLSQMLGHIRNDEVNHFKHFLKFFKEMQDESPVGRTCIAKSLYGRLKELRDSDTEIALRHVWMHKGAYFEADLADSQLALQEMAGRIYALISRRLPTDLAVRMLLKPMMLPPPVESLIRAPISTFAKRVLAHG